MNEMKKLHNCVIIFSLQSLKHHHDKLQHLRRFIHSRCSSYLSSPFLRLGSLKINFVHDPNKNKEKLVCRSSSFYVSFVCESLYFLCVLFLISLYHIIHLELENVELVFFCILYVNFECSKKVKSFAFRRVCRPPHTFCSREKWIFQLKKFKTSHTTEISIYNDFAIIHG